MSCYKRILNELKNKIPEKMRDLDLDNKFTFVELGTDIVSKEIGVINKKTDQIELKIVIPPDYPFKPPLVHVMEDVVGFGVSPTIKYDYWSGSIIRRITQEPEYDLFLAWTFSVIRRPELIRYWRGIIPNRNDCLCCESITCRNNWSPSIMMSDILCEYVVRRDFKINCGPLTQRWISPIFNNDRWVIPDDLILHIIKGHAISRFAYAL